VVSEVDSRKSTSGPEKHETESEWEGPRKQGLYDPALEKEACGVGFVVSIEGTASHKVRCGESWMGCLHVSCECWQSKGRLCEFMSCLTSIDNLLTMGQFTAN
jgi:hypothetical protein